MKGIFHRRDPFARGISQEGVKPNSTMISCFLALSLLSMLIATEPRIGRDHSFPQRRCRLNPRPSQPARKPRRDSISLVNTHLP